MVEQINTLIEQRCALTIRRLTDPAADNDAAAEPTVKTTVRTRVRFRVWELNRHPIADEFDARFRRPAWLRNLLAGLQSGRLYDRVRNGSQQPAALLLRTFNSRLVPGAAPPPNKARKHWVAVEKVAESCCGLRLF